MDPSVLLKFWRKLSWAPGGKLLFSKILGKRVPYTGSISPQVILLEPGHAMVEMADRKSIRNHLKSIHAIALMNLAEATSGLALLTGLPKGARGILTGLSIRYLKKARGRISGECRVEDFPDEISSQTEKKVSVALRNENSEIVAEAEALWMIGPEKKSGS